MLILILDAKTSVSGAVSGVALCMQAVIPSLFPFFVLSSLITGALTGTSLRWMRVIGKWLRIPACGESIFLTGLVGGYPLGAAMVADACRKKRLTDRDAMRMMAFCSNAGPAFIFGMAGNMFESRWVPCLLWIFQILAAAITAAVLPGEPRAATLGCTEEVSLVGALKSALYAMASVCGWVVLFRVLISFLQRWCLWLLPAQGQVLAMGILELSNGCFALEMIGNQGTRLILCALFLSFGGLCVLMQTASVSQGADIRMYFPGKCMQACICVALSCMAQFLFPKTEREQHSFFVFAAALILGVIFSMILRKMQKNSRNQLAVGV